MAEAHPALPPAAAAAIQAVVSLLLSAGANPNARDNLGGSPLLEAVKAGHMQVVQQLTAVGATLQLSVSELSSALCSMVLQGQADLLRRYIAAGADMGAWDYDKRTALHIAAAEDRLDMVSVQQLLAAAIERGISQVDTLTNTVLSTLA